MRSISLLRNGKDNLIPDLGAVRQSLTRHQTDYDHARRAVTDEKTALSEAENRLEIAVQAQKLLQGVAEAVQQQAHQQIAAVVTRCLEAVFGEDAYEFVIQFEQKRGKTEAQLLFRRDGLCVDPTSSAGGGVVDTASFALRLACLILSRPAKRRLLVLDEPFRFLSREYRPAVRELLLTLAKELGVQIIMVTHSTELVCGKVVEL